VLGGCVNFGFLLCCVAVVVVGLHCIFVCGYFGDTLCCVAVVVVGLYCVV